MKRRLLPRQRGTARQAASQTLSPQQLQELVDRRTAELQQLNDELATSRDKAEAATRAKSTFLANMSHEIRTPLNAILGITHLLRRDAHDDVATERLAKVNDAATHLLEVINDILDLSKIESGQFELEQIDFSMRELVARNCALLGERARSKGLAIVNEVRGLPDALRGDPTRLSQALLNLLSNAVKFTETGSVTVRGETERTADADLRLRFTVTDTGVGVEPGHLDQLFNAFVQADASTTRRFGGTGLGLAITRRLAELMGGEVGARSSPGQGSEFWFTARVMPSPAVAPASGPSTADAPDAEVALRQQHAGARVLLAEDNPVNQEVAVELLQSVGIVVDVANNGAEAIARTRLRAYDLVLMDVQMPVMGGLDAARAMRTLPETARVPILAMTADAFGETRRACLAAGMDGHVAKPVNPTSLYAALQRWLPVRAIAEAPPATPAAPAADGPATTPAWLGLLQQAAPAAAPTGIAGVDVGEALAHVGGRVEVYRRVLRQFVQHYGRSLAEVGAQLACGDALRMRSAAHSIRGAAVSIGARTLATLAGNFEEAVVNARLSAPELLPAGRAVLHELRSVLVAIGQYLGPESPPSLVTAQPPISTPALEQLERLLADGDYQATALHRELADGLRAAFGETADSIGAHLRDFEFGKALSALRTLRARQSV